MPNFSVQPNPKVRYTVIHADPDFLIVAKPPGVVTQPGVGHDRDTLLNGLFVEYGKRLQNLGKARDFGLIHRLDRPTSGLVAIGLTREGYDGLRSQFEQRTIEKTYLALVHGVPRPAHGIERASIRAERRGGRKTAVLTQGRGAKEAVTEYRTLLQGNGASLVQCAPKTGRLHQIRVHLRRRGSPVVGDRDYGPRKPLDKRFSRAVRKAIFLHAGRLRFEHPVNGGWMTIQAPLPDGHQAFLETVGMTCPRAWR